MELWAILSYNNNGNMADLTCCRALRELSIGERDKKNHEKFQPSVQYIMPRNISM
jgi:hypothetical protein